MRNTLQHIHILGIREVGNVSRGWKKGSTGARDISEGGRSGGATGSQGGSGVAVEGASKLKIIYFLLNIKLM
jgi:hypothetical protein